MERSKQARTSSLKALQAIKENSIVGRNAAKLKKNEVELGGVKRSSSPSAINPPLAKRNALGNITNVTNNPSLLPLPPLPEVLKPEAVVQANSNIDEGVEDDQLPRRSKRLSKKSTSSSPPSNNELNLVCNETLDSGGSSSMNDVQQVLQATSLSDKSVMEESSTPLWNDIDEAEMNDPLFSSEYAPDIYTYMKDREDYFMVGPYLDHQPLINSSMRTILIDWLVEVQENFELFHETLYLSVKIVDRYLEQKEVRKEYLQLVGATAMLIAAKFEELSPPLVDDFIYLCDDAYQHDELLTMERNILATLNYDINAPVAYRFLRRLARAAVADMKTHTLARYICESTLQEYDYVSERPSHLASAAMYLALRMRKLGQWTPTLHHYSGYQVLELLPLVQRLNELISKPVNNTSTVRSKYSHEVFQSVALIPPVHDVYEDYHICFPTEERDGYTFTT